MIPEVFFSDDINTSDTVEFAGNSFTFKLQEPNNEGRELVLLYMYFLPDFASHGIKVGMTKCRSGETFGHAIKKRISNQKNELALKNEGDYEKYGTRREVIYWGVCLDAKNEDFKDYAVHKQIMIENAGLTIKEQEWFNNTPKDKLIELFNKVRSEGRKKILYTPRKEQRECIDALLKFFENKPKGERFLLNCKMRFGKSYVTYKFCEEAKLKRVLILTFVPAVEESWEEDLSHISSDYKYFTDEDLRQPLFHLRSIDSPYVLFLSLQNFLGKDKQTNDVKAKISKLKEEHFDLIILDEYHFGAWNQRTQEKLEGFDNEYQNALRKTTDVISKFGIKTDKTLCLSGTPFKAISRGEFTSLNSFTYSYFDEQKNKYPNDDFENPNPDYAMFPDMKIFGYNMSVLFGNFTDKLFSSDKLLSKKYFSLNKFFETRNDSNKTEPNIFVYEEEIKWWLEIIKGRSTFGGNFPYFKQEMLENNKHTLWLLPTVNSCIAMAKLLSSDEYFQKYEIINLSDPNVGSGNDALDYLNANINKVHNGCKIGSVALTVNKLTIGVTVKEWSSVFVLKDLASPEQYFQSIFRIQTPLVCDGKILKKVGYVYDFNIDRAAALLLSYAQDSSSEQCVTKLDIAKLIVKYMPIFMNGDMSKPIACEVFYQLAQFGDKSGVPLSRKITDLESTTHVLNEETISQMLNDPAVSEIIKRVFAHSRFKKDKKRTMAEKPSTDGYSTKVAQDGRDKGYQLGLSDSKLYLSLDDTKIQKSFEDNIERHLLECRPKEYKETEVIWYSNGFKDGYEKGVNVPVKNLFCGSEDGKGFVVRIKNEFGQNILYTTETGPRIKDFVHKFLNDINNIPPQYRGSLYKRWYKDSFERKVRSELKPPLPPDSKGSSVEDCDNVLKHILARLVEFLYISVYRETTFREIFKNADPNVFLEAVGIKKEEFETLNKYHIFEENTLNNYIREFFINESTGESLDLSDEKVKKQYRNSFNWFGFNK